MSPRVMLDPGRCSLADWQAIAGGALAGIVPAARAAVERAHSAVQRSLASGAAVYGVNTGFGKLASARIAPNDLAALQLNLIRSHAAGVGPALPENIVRLIMAMKAASLARGASGVRWAVIETMEQMLEAGVIPVVPAKGSVGASGDLAPLAHMTAAMIGESEAFFKGERLPSAAALARAGIKPLALGPKEGLAMINGTQVSTALALAGLFTARRVFEAACIAGAMTVDAVKGSDTPFDARIHALRGQPGQSRVAAALLNLMAGSAIRDSHRTGDDKVQDPYSLRCQPQVMGAVFDLLKQAAETLLIESNAVTDNPLVLDDGSIVSGGNFHAEPVAFAADIIAIALAEIGNISERRIAILVDPVMSRLPAFLARDPGLNSGYMIAQVTAAALASENKQRAHPASVDSIPTSANQEDHVSMATYAAYRLVEMGQNASAIVAIELLASADGIEYHRPLRSSKRLEQVHAVLRASIPAMTADRLIAPDIEAVAKMVSAGVISSAAGLDIF